LKGGGSLGDVGVDERILISYKNRGEGFGLDLSGLEQGSVIGSYKYENKPLGSIGCS
jgi:hypothetical protein